MICHHEPAKSEKAGRAVYLLRIQQTRPNGGDIRAMRWLLKRLLRNYGFRCLAAHEEVPR
jgi:hypothetical protein